MLTGDANKMIATLSKDDVLSETILFGVDGRSAESLSVSYTKESWLSRANFARHMARIYVAPSRAGKIIAFLSRDVKEKLSYLCVNAK